MKTSENPYQPPASEIELPKPADDPEVIRISHMRIEDAIRGIGSMLTLLGFLLVGLVIYVFGLLACEDGLIEALEDNGVATGFGAGLGAALMLVGKRIYHLRSNAQGFAKPPCMLGVMMFPVGTMICGWYLYLIFCEKGIRVFSADYQRVIAATPHVQSRHGLVLLLHLSIWIVAFALLWLVLKNR